MKNKPILGVFYSHSPSRLGNLELVNELRINFKIIIIANKEIDYLSLYSDDLIIHKFSDHNGILNKILKYKNEYGIDGLITLSEGAVTLLSDIGTKIDVPVNDFYSSRIARNKFLMRSFFLENKIDGPIFFKVHSLKEAKEIFTNSFEGKSCFLKPPCIGGSSFCKQIKNINELDNIWDYFYNNSYDRTKDDPLFEEMFLNKESYYLLLEETLGGNTLSHDDNLAQEYPIYEISVEGFITKNHTYVYSITDKLLPKRGILYGEEYLWRMHSRLPSEFKKILIKKVNYINKKIGAKVGCSHTEFRIEETNKESSEFILNNKLYRSRIIETALRIGGAFMQSAIYKSTGFNSIRAMAYQACGIKHKEKVFFRKPMIMVNFWPNKSGVLQKIEGLDAVYSYKNKISDFHLYDAIGDNVKVPPDASRGIADIIITSNNIDLLQIRNWEVKTSSENPYNEVEKIYLDVTKKIKFII